MSLAVAGLLVLLVSAEGLPSSPPAELACLARHYAVLPVFEQNAWHARLPDGARVPWDDGRRKTFAERLAAPDLEDMFAIPYRGGLIRPVDDEDDDPGRVRVERIFSATYGPHVAVQQVATRFLGLPVRVHRKILTSLARVAERLTVARRIDAGLALFLRRLSGGFAPRKIAGTDRTSAHTFGIAIDLDSSLADYWRWEPSAGSRCPLVPASQPAPHSSARARWHKCKGWRNRIPQAIVDAFEAEGFIWGGRWYHYDTMHFEYRPELFGPACRALPE
jgi:hypothetical protein